MPPRLTLSFLMKIIGVDRCVCIKPNFWKHVRTEQSLIYANRAIKAMITRCIVLSKSFSIA